MNQNVITALLDVAAERAAQDEEWGGPGHDDTHDLADWCDFLEKHTARARFTAGTGLARRHLIRIAALAVAAVESIDRITAPRNSE